MASNGPDKATGMVTPRKASSSAPPWPADEAITVARAS